MRVGIFAAEPSELCQIFIRRHFKALSENGISIAMIVVDDNTSKSQGFIKHALKISRRQAKVAECSPFMAFLKIVFYKMLLRFTHKSGPSELADGGSDIPTIRVPTLNSSHAIQAIQSSKCDIVCLMGTRILTKKTLQKLNLMVLNIHSSDPAFVRGGPVVFWEVLAKRDHITLTVHEVIEEVDAGDVLGQAVAPIHYSKGLGLTVQKTIKAAQTSTADLFLKVLLDIKNKKLSPKKVPLGPLRVTPSICEALKAEFYCRSRSK